MCPVKNFVRNKYVSPWPLLTHQRTSGMRVLVQILVETADQRCCQQTKRFSTAQHVHTCPLFSWLGVVRGLRWQRSHVVYISRRKHYGTCYIIFFLSGVLIHTVTVCIYAVDVLMRPTITSYSSTLPHLAFKSAEWVGHFETLVGNFCGNWKTSFYPYP